MVEVSSGWGSLIDQQDTEEVEIKDRTFTRTEKPTTQSSGWGSLIDSDAEVPTSKTISIDTKDTLPSDVDSWGSSIEVDDTVIPERKVDLSNLAEPEESLIVTSDGISMLPSADVDTRTTDELSVELADELSIAPEYVKKRSGWDRTKKAWEEFKFPFLNEDGEELSEKELEELGGTIKTALTETTKEGRSVLTPYRKPTPDEILLAKAVDGRSGNTKLLFNVANALALGGGVALDVIEDTLELMKDQRIGGAVFEFLTKGANELRGVSGIETPEDLTNLIGDASLDALEFSESIPALGAISTLLSVRSLLPDIQADVGVKLNKRKETETYKRIRNNVGGAVIATREARNEARILADTIAIENKDIKDELIREYETRVGGKKISVEKNGHLEIDMDAAKASAAEQLREPFKVIKEGDDVDIVEDPLARLVGIEEGLVSPILNPDKLNSLVAVIKDYKTKMKESGQKDIFAVPNKRPMQAILEVSIMKDLEGTNELIDTLNKYDLNLEEFVLGSVGSFSQAGKVLSVASQFKRVKAAGDISEAKNKKLMEAQADIANASQRLENVRRGALVSKFATAMRNLESFGARLPMESMMNMIDEVVRSYSKPIRLGPDPQGGFVGATKTAFSKQSWKDSFGAYKYAFSRPDVAKGYLDLIYGNPMFATQYNKMYDNLNEIQKASGRGSGGTADKVLSPLEDTVEMMNFANRWQETLTRNAVAMNEIERLVKLEYGIDFIDALQDGKLPDLMRDSTTVRPDGARSFSAIVADATDKAVKVTYGGQPENDMFAAMTNFLTSKKIGGVVPLTLLVEFPRFMFSSMEFMAESVAGAGKPLIMKAVGAQKGPLTAKQHRAIQRNLVGAAAIGAAYLYRTSENAPERYEDVRIMGKDADTTTQFPVRQFLWLGEAIKRIEEGTFDMWFDIKEAAETFVGTAFRTGTGNIIIEEVTSILDGTDVSLGKKAAEIAGESISNYITGFGNFFSQLADFQRGIPLDPTDLESTEMLRPDVYKQELRSAAKTATEAFVRELGRGPQRSGLTRTAEEERAMPTKVTVFPEDAVRPDAGWKTLLGISLKDQDSEDGEFVTSLGIPKWKIGSNSDVDEIKAFENKKISEFIPLIVEKLQYRKGQLVDKYNSLEEGAKEKITQEQYVLRQTRDLFEGTLSNFKSFIRAVSPAAADKFSVASSEYGRIPKKFRTSAYIKYIADSGGKEPDLTSVEDLTTLTELAKLLRKTSKSITFK